MNVFQILLTEDDDNDEQANTTGEVEPLTYAQAMKGPDANKWNEAMIQEYKVLLEVV